MAEDIQVSKDKTRAADAADKALATFVRIGEGDWYVIPPAMAEAFRKAGAEVVCALAPPPR